MNHNKDQAYAGCQNGPATRLLPSTNKVEMLNAKRPLNSLICVNTGAAAPRHQITDDLSSNHYSGKLLQGEGECGKRG